MQATLFPSKSAPLPVAPQSSSLLSHFSKINQSKQQNAVEIDSYLDEPSIGMNENSLAWWCTNQHRYSVLSKMAKKYLAVTASSAPPGRVFFILELFAKKKTRTLPQNFEKLKLKHKQK